MLLAVLKREVQEALELMEIIGDKCCVVCLVNSSHRYAKDGGAKATVLCSGKLLIVIDLVVLAAVGPALLQAKLVLDGAHGVLLPLAVRGTI